MADQADPSPAHPAPHTQAHVDELVDVTVRRSPRYGVFLALGAALGILVALILTFSIDSSGRVADNGAVYSQGQVFGFLALVGVAVGLALGGIVALILDRTIGRRSRTVRVDHETVETLD